MRRRWWIILAAVVWAVVLAVLAFATHGEPTVAAQQSPAGARPAVNKAVTGVLSAADGLAVAAAGDYHQVRACSVNVARGGVDYQRTVDLYGADGDLLDRITKRLPASYKARPASVLHDSAAVTVAHPDPFLKLTIRGIADDPGHLRAIVDTGCRPTTGHPYAELLRAPSAAERAPVERAFALLKVKPARWDRSVLPCGAVTVTATGHATESLSPLPSTLKPGTLPGTLVTHNDDRFVYRGTPDLIVGTTMDLLTVTSTTACH